MSGLQQLLVAHIADGGPIGFDEYQANALYAPEVGFYTSGRGAGRRRDFLTSPEVGPLFGTILSRALDSWWEEAGRAGRLPRRRGRGRSRHPGPDDPGRQPHVRRRVAAGARGARRGPVGHPPRRRHEPSGPARSGRAGRWARGGPGQRAARQPAGGHRRADRRSMGRGRRHGRGRGRRQPDLHAPPTRRDPPAMVRRPRRRTPRTAPASRSRPKRVPGCARPSPSPPAAGSSPSTTPAPPPSSRPCRWGRGCAPMPITAAPATPSTTPDRATSPATSPSTSSSSWPSPRRSGPRSTSLHDHGLDDLVDEGREVWADQGIGGGLDAIAAQSRVREAEALTDPAGLGSFTVVEWAG